MLARRAIQVVASTLAFTAIVGTLWILVLLPGPVRVEVPAITDDTFVNSVAQFRGDVWIGTSRGYFRLRDGFEPPNQFAVDPSGTEVTALTQGTLLVVGRDALWVWVGNDHWVRETGESRSFRPEGAPDAPSIPMSIAPMCSPGRRTPGTPPTYSSILGGLIIAAEGPDGTWFRDPEWAGVIERLAPDGTITAYVSPAFLDPRLRPLGRKLAAILLAGGYVGTVLILLSRAADLVKARRRAWFAYALAAILAATQSLLVLRIVQEALSVAS